MYRIIKKEDTIRVPPAKLEEDYGGTITELTKYTFEGTFDSLKNLIISISEVEPIGQGHIVHGDGSVYQRVSYKALAFAPPRHEIVNGVIIEVLKFGAFVRFGPMDGLLHISQIMDDHVDVDLVNERLVGKESGHELKVDDLIRARIVTYKINERNPNESRIGLTMRQPGLGKLEWLEETRRELEEGKKPPAPDEGKKSKKKGRKKKNT